MRSIQMALRKRPVDPERVERMVNGIVRQLESTGEAEITSEQIGQLVMEGLRARRRRLCALRLGLSQFPRGQGFRGLRRRARRRGRGAVARMRNDLPHSGRSLAEISTSKQADRRFMAAGASLGRAQSRPDLAQSRRRRCRGQGRRHRRPRLDAPGGRPHAEAMALRRGRRGGARRHAYVTLEPCAHEGRRRPAPMRWSPPVSAASSRRSPTPIRGSGAGACEAAPAGVAVDVGLGRRRRRALMPGTSAASATGAARHPEARHFGGRHDRRREGEPLIDHRPRRVDAVQVMRAQSDAVVIGIGTVLVDNPRLTCRLPGMEERSPVRIVLDRALRIPADTRLVIRPARSRCDPRVGPEAPAETQGRAQAAVHSDRGRRTPGARPEETCAPAAEGLTRILVEGGAGSPPRSSRRTCRRGRPSPRPTASAPTASRP